MPDILIFGDSIRSPEMRHEVPIPVPDAFLYVERDGVRHVIVSSMEAVRMGDLEELDVHPLEHFGYDEVLASGIERDRIDGEVARRVCAGLGIREALVPPGFPLELADLLRADGITVTADRELFKARRRVKSETELAGIRRAQRAAEAGMAAARELLRQARANGGGLELDGEPLTSEREKLALEEVFSQHECSADEMIVSHGAQSAIGHHMGAGGILPDEPLVIDIWPRDRATGCYADMTRTFVVGTPSDELREWHRLTLQALEEAIAATRPGVPGREINHATCELFERHGHPTMLSKQDGVPLENGFFHGLGHGIGLEVHEPPNLGVAGHDPLIAGDVVTIEPGLYRKGYGGVRLEDLVLVADDGPENLTSFPYDLTP